MVGHDVRKSTAGDAGQRMREAREEMSIHYPWWKGFQIRERGRKGARGE